MGGANGSREYAPDDKLRDTHQFEFAEMMGFEGLNPSYELRAASSRAQAKSRDPAATKQPDGQITQSLSSPSRKNISLSPSGKSLI